MVSMPAGLRAIDVVLLLVMIGGARDIIPAQVNCRVGSISLVLMWC